MKTLDAQQTKTALPYPGLYQALAQMLGRRHAGRTHSPERLVLNMSEGATLLAMSATDGEYACSKLVSVQPSNPSRGLPSILGEVVLLDSVTGERLLRLDGPTVTSRRTAALSILAIQRLSRHPDAPCLLIGTGIQGLAHIEAIAETLRPPQLYIKDHDPERAHAAAAYAQSLGLQAKSVQDVGEALGEVGTIISATTSRAPTFPPHVRPGTCVVGIGAFTPEMAELPPELLQNVPIYVDTLHGAKAEAGDLLQANVDWQRVQLLEEASEPLGETVVFKSVGDALWDLAAARFAYSHVSSQATV